MHINRGLVFWGIALVTAGAVALAIQAGVIPGDTARDAWRFWPVVLIVIGLAVIAARTPLALAATLVAGLAVGGLGGTLVAGWPDGFSFGCTGDLDDSRTESGVFSGSADVHLELNCGDLDLSTAPGGGWEVTARHASGSEPEFTTTDDALSVRAEGGPWFTDARQAWHVTIPSDVELVLDVEANAASSRLDLRDATLAELALDANAGDVAVDLRGADASAVEISANAGSLSLTVDDGTTATGSMSVNAGSMELCAPDGVVVAITIEDANVTFSHNLDERGLDRSGDTWSTGEGTAAVELDVEGNAGSFTLNPDGGCE
jgi:hypothetical protein